MPHSSNSSLRIRPQSATASFSYVSQASAPSLLSPPPEPGPDVHHCAPGPWGEIEYRFIYLEAADHLVAQFRMPNTAPRWSFPGATTEQLAALFETADVPPEWRERWLSRHLLAQNGVLHLLPPVEDLEALTPEQRAIIYRELAASDLNEFHRDPVFITSGRVEEFLHQTGVSAEHARWFSRMCYRRGQVLCFSDVAALLGRARSDTEARRLFKLCSRTRAVIARLKLTPQTDGAALLDYWSTGAQRRDALPMLQSIAGARAATELDLVHLLPPLARKLLNSYPPLELAFHGRMPDCHWSSLNFFNHEPRHYYLDSRLAASHVLENFTPIEPPYRFGDVLFFLEGPNENAFHSCVYIADDLVFTKNGDNAANPWILTRLGDLEQVYLSGKGGRLQAYRRLAP